MGLLLVNGEELGIVHLDSLSPGNPFLLARARDVPFGEWEFHLFMIVLGDLGVAQEDVVAPIAIDA